MTTPRLGAPELVQNQAAPETTVNEIVRWLDAASLGGFKFLDRDLSTPPGSPSEGDCYLVAGTGTGDWTGHDGDVALYINTAWEFCAPQEGFEAWVADEDVKIAFDGSSWGIIGTFDGADYIPSSYLDTDDTLAADSDVKVPTQQAVKAYVDNEIAGIAAAASETTAAEFRAGTQAGEYISPDIAFDAAATVALSESGGNVAVDMSSGFNFTLSMTGNWTLSNPTNAKVGQTGFIQITQDGTGSRTLAYGSNWKFAGGTDPTLSTAASSVDVLFYQVLTTSSIVANLVKAIA